MISAVSGPTRTRRRLPTGTMLSIAARTWFCAESTVSARAIEISHGWTTTPTGPEASSVDTISSPPSSTTSVRPSTRTRAFP